MGAALDHILDLATLHHGKWSWDAHPAAPGFFTVELAVPDTPEPLDGAGPTIDQAALNLLAAHYPLAIQCDPVLTALLNEHTPSEAY